MIDKHAVVHPNAQIAANVHIGPFSVIGADVEIGEGTWIGSHVVVEGKTKIGRNNKIFQFAAIGAEPQHKKYQGEPTTVEIGDENVIREFCTVHRGTVQGRSTTKIGNQNFLMNYVHIAHDCELGNGVVFANNASLAGHVTVGDYANFGGFAKVLQFCTIGEHCFVAGATDIVKDVPPYILVAGPYNDVKVYGLNLIGLKRFGFKDEVIKTLEKAYDLIYRSNLTVVKVIPELEKLAQNCQEVYGFINILKNSKKGIVR